MVMEQVSENQVLSTLTDKLKELGLSISTAESCTGGNIAHAITLQPGSSAYYKGSVVSYCNEVKMSVLGVKRESIEKETEVSGMVAKEMAEGVRQLMHTDIGVSTTGIAGPTGAMPGKPVGTVYIAAASGLSTEVKRFEFIGDRESVIKQATNAAIEMACEAAKSL